MEDFIGLIVLIIYLFAASSGKKKKAQKKRKKQKDGFKKAFAGAAQSRQEPLQHPSSLEAQVRTPVKESDCAQQPIHLHEVSQQQMRLAQEGDDPCHAGGAMKTQPQENHFSYEEEEKDGELVQDVLRGVIMSEILTRPCERVALKRNRWSEV